MSFIDVGSMVRINTGSHAGCFGFVHKFRVLVRPNQVNSLLVFVDVYTKDLRLNPLSIYEIDDLEPFHSAVSTSKLVRANNEDHAIALARMS